MDDEIPIEQNGKWYKRVSAQKAFDIRCDVQLYLWDKGKVSPDIADPLKYRQLREQPTSANSPTSNWWQGYPYYIEVDSPTKEEYTP